MTVLGCQGMIDHGAAQVRDGMRSQSEQVHGGTCNAEGARL